MTEKRCRKCNDKLRGDRCLVCDKPKKMYVEYYSLYDVLAHCEAIGRTGCIDRVREYFADDILGDEVIFKFRFVFNDDEHEKFKRLFSEELYYDFLLVYETFNMPEIVNFKLDI